MPPTRFGHMRTSSVQAGAAAQPSSTPVMSSGTAALPCPMIASWPTNSAVMMKIIWLLPPMAMAEFANQPSTLGCGGVTIYSAISEVIATSLASADCNRA